MTNSRYMPDRRPKRPSYTIDVVILTPVRSQLAVLLWRSTEGREKWTLPWDSARPGEALDTGAGRIGRAVLGTDPAWIEQIGAFGDGKRHPAESEISVGYAALVPMGTPSPVGGDYAWFPLQDVPHLAPRQRSILDSAVLALRSRMDQAPVAFKLLPQMFTLTELQQMYELLLGKRLHKASFRRALQGAWLVEPTDEWRSEGRGRPAQLYRYAPRRRRPAQRGIRLDLLSS
ncbi:MAG TPA: NUDIX domain-containing protein [Gemmatimonadaceae bacterium]|nr:NUDIX domain-containing protein [Gemmatimonadaceae bacterium]